MEGKPCPGQLLGGFSTTIGQPCTCDVPLLIKLFDQIFHILSIYRTSLEDRGPLRWKTVRTPSTSAGPVPLGAVPLGRTGRPCGRCGRVHAALKEVKELSKKVTPTLRCFGPTIQGWHQKPQCHKPTEQWNDEKDRSLSLETFWTLSMTRLRHLQPSQSHHSTFRHPYLHSQLKTLSTVLQPLTTLPAFHSRPEPARTPWLSWRLMRGRRSCGC